MIKELCTEPQVKANLRVVSAAMLMKDGGIIAGVRHFSPDMRDVLFRLYGKDYHLKVAEQGFILSDYSFASRENAYLIAKNANQIIRNCGGDNGKLFSENLY